MADEMVEPRDVVVHDHALELRKEAFTMALYVAICLLAAVAGVNTVAEPEQSEALSLVWGTTIGLALAHWFAFQVSAKLVASGSMRHQDFESAVAQLVGALSVSVVATVAIVLVPTSIELEMVEFVLSGFIAVVGFAVARSGGASTARSAVYGIGVLLIASAVVVLKNTLIGHH